MKYTVVPGLQDFAVCVARQHQAKQEGPRKLSQELKKDKAAFL